MFSTRYQYIAILFCCVAGGLASCTQDEKQNTPVAAAPVKAALMAPFRYHKMIESSPGKYFDVFGWGRGKDSSGAYMILHSDSTGKQYSNTGGDLEGSIIDIYNTDMNMDGNPEILIEAKAKDTTNHVNIYAYEFRGAKSQKLDFPKLTTKTKKGYRGDDNFYIKDGSLVREFPIYEGSGKNAKPTGKKKILQYSLRNNVFSVNDISPVDSSAIKKPVIVPVAKKPVAKVEKPTVVEKKSTKKKKKQKEETHTKKRKHKPRD
ncbi:hypothetical protein BDD43_3870 [Mucilaginibacter gracilis]|uniref:PliI/PliC-like inhibitor of I-type lysozyme n=1 Tax=Mucilaginibacter gracilis TaxID=423350 RepID=A0A495J3X4_9SPHI|nr:hypothetical protein [Mucilaginibacter gracilis]RKR83657.1 hypothetical protein BDD43_3870 [Mucilaginibacter gracilis]